MGIKCIALDLDGTTLCSDKQISTRTKKAIEQAIEDGIHVVVASGRCLDALPKSVTDIVGVEYAITSNGAAVYELSSGRCLRRVTLETQAVEEILKITENRKLHAKYFTREFPMQIGNMWKIRLRMVQRRMRMSIFEAHAIRLKISGRLSVSIKVRLMESI